MARRQGPLIALGALAALVLAGTTFAPASPAAEPGRRGADHASHDRAPGKGDSDGDKIADDLEAALASAARGDRLRVIVQGVTADQAERAAPSLHVGRSYHSIEAFAGSMTAGQVRALAHRRGVTRIELNGQVRAMDASGDLDYGVTAARGAGAATDSTLDGSGVGICLIDTGIDPNHVQLAGRIIGWKDWVNDGLTPYDDHGHGTHVASIAAGKPTSAANAAYGGVATGASLIGAKVLAANGFGEDADVVSAIEWCAALPEVDVISMSLGSPGSDGSDAGSQAADAAVAAGKVVVAAAGNDGDAPGTISSPGVATDVITVGAASDPSALAGSTDTDSGLYLAGFSSRGPTTNPAAPIKPDVVGPGISVVAAKAGTTDAYVTMSGTSMATPFVAGVVALGLEADPAATPAQVKQALRSSAHDAGASGPDNEWGAGLVDARSFLAALGAAGPGSVAWADQQLITGTVGAGSSTDFPFTIGIGGQPLGVSLRTVNGYATCVLPVGGTCWYGYEWSPDIDAYLVNPAGTVVAMSRCMLEASNDNCGAPGRFETLGVASAAAGTWKLRVESFSGAGNFEAAVIGALGTVEPPPPTPPADPTGLSVTATTTSTVALAWIDASGNEDGFTVQRCEGGSCTSFTTIATLPAGATSYSDIGLNAGTSYSYRVRAFNSAGASGWSETSTSTQNPPPPPPAAPTGLTATSATTSSVNLAWNDASVNEEGFTLQRCEGGGCTNFVTIATLPAGTTLFGDIGLNTGTSYSYRVRAFNSAGTSGWSETTTRTLTPPVTAPAAPTGLVATAASGTRIGLTWVDRSNNETGFRVLRCVGSKCTPTAVLVTLAAGTISFNDVTVLPRTTYRYRIQSFNSAGAGSSAIVKVTTPRR
jgi:serine protease AprX